MHREQNQEDAEGQATEMAESTWQKKVLCRYFMSVGCLRGDECSYSHDASLANKGTVPCRFFRAGTCAHGLNCRFSHDQGAGTSDFISDLDTDDAASTSDHSNSFNNNFVTDTGDGGVEGGGEGATAALSSVPAAPFASLTPCQDPNCSEDLNYSPELQIGGATSPTSSLSNGNSSSPTSSFYHIANSSSQPGCGTSHPTPTYIVYTPVLPGSGGPGSLASPPAVQHHHYHHFHHHHVPGMPRGHTNYYGGPVDYYTPGPQDPKSASPTFQGYPSTSQDNTYSESFSPGSAAAYITSPVPSLNSSDLNVSNGSNDVPSTSQNLNEEICGNSVPNTDASYCNTENSEVEGLTRTEERPTGSATATPVVSLRTNSQPLSEKDEDEDDEALSEVESTAEEEAATEDEQELANDSHNEVKTVKKDITETKAEKATKTTASKSDICDQTSRDKSITPTHSEGGSAKITSDEALTDSEASKESAGATWSPPTNWAEAPEFVPSFSVQPSGLEFLSTSTGATTKWTGKAGGQPKTTVSSAKDAGAEDSVCHECSESRTSCRCVSKEKGGAKTLLLKTGSRTEARTSDSHPAVDAGPRSWAQVVNAGIATYPDAQMTISQAESMLCPFYQVGECRYDVGCVYVHGDICDYCGRASLHPTHQDQRRKHLAECLRQHEQDMELSFAVARSKEKTCGICMEVVLEKPKGEARFGILPSCTHCFCLPCIRKWRQAKFEHKIIRACPECRQTSDYICPSRFWVETPEEKERLLTEYKKNLGLKECKYFANGTGECPFGNKCFYKHADKDGRIVDVGPPKKPVRRVDADDNYLLAPTQALLYEFLEERGMFPLEYIEVLDLLSDSDMFSSSESSSGDGDDEDSAP